MRAGDRTPDLVVFAAALPPAELTLVRRNFTEKESYNNFFQKKMVKYNKGRFRSSQEKLTLMVFMVKARDLRDS